MTMQAMVETLESSGFDVKKFYDTNLKGYRFTIRKNDCRTSALFEYPADTSREYCDQKQREFIDYIINKWHKDHFGDTDDNKPKKKVVFVGIGHKYLIADHMAETITELSSKGISATRRGVYYAGFDTPHVHVRYVCSGDDENDLQGLRADAVFGSLWDIMVRRMNPGADNWQKLGIGLVSYIWNAEGYTVADMYPPSQMYITMPPRNGKSLYKRILNAVYGKSPDPTIQLQLYAALMKGENNMPTRNESNIAALAAAFRNIDRAFNRKLPDIKNVIFSGPCTIVLWEDGTKTVVRCNNDVLDPEKGLAMAIAKKAMGTNKSGSNYYDIFKQWLPKEEAEEEE